MYLENSPRMTSTTDSLSFLWDLLMIMKSTAIVSVQTLWPVPNPPYPPMGHGVSESPCVCTFGNDDKYHSKSFWGMRQFDVWQSVLRLEAVEQGAMDLHQRFHYQHRKLWTMDASSGTTSSAGNAKVSLVLSVSLKIGTIVLNSGCCVIFCWIKRHLDCITIFTKEWKLIWQPLATICPKRPDDWTVFHDTEAGMTKSWPI